MSVWAGNMMRDANFLKGVKFLILSTLVSLHCNDFTIKLSLNKTLELIELLKNFRFMFKKINTGKLAIVINETNIIFFFFQLNQG